MIAQLFALALAGAMPNYDIPNVCKGVGSLGVVNPATAYQGCVHDEQSAQETLKSVWSDVPAAVRAKCVEEAQTFAPSYIEILACIEMEPRNYIGVYRSPEPPLEQPPLDQPPLVGRSRPDRQ